MKAIPFPESNGVLTAPNCADLPMHTHREGIISCWELSADEKRQVMVTGKVWLFVAGQNHPPVTIMTEDPFCRNEIQLEGGQ